MTTCIESSGGGESLVRESTLECRDEKMPSEQDIYEEHVLDHYEDPYHRGPFDEATHAHEADNPLCGDEIHIDLKLNSDGKVAEAWFDGAGCVISQASASMLIETIEGKTLEELQQFSAQDMLALFGPKLTPNRQKCCLLSWRVLQSAIHSPIDPNEDDVDGPSFSGPSLGEES
ncbi:iron-sulfur cluster assembly scaffold protein [Rubripirellula sp.]|nr:iron-sulfur cluster assembly scaffold protein [Rubripirellula sp.]MDB4621504.1 iron-sulfur cluster assembly scaffold protein [Rubripirellula sp.]